MMAVKCNRRKAIRYVWLGLIISTVVACAVFVYISLLFGKEYHSGSRTSQDFSSRSEKQIEEKCIPVCDSKACVYHSNFLLKHVEPIADRCENFFQFACGKYVEQFSREESRSFYLEQYLEMKLMLKNLLKNIQADPENIAGKLKIVFDSCIKQSSSDFQAIPTVLKYLSSFGIPNWPYLDTDFQFVERNLSDVLINFLTYQEYGFIDIIKGYGPRRPQTNATITTAESTYEKKEKTVRKYLVEKVLKFFDLEPASMDEIWEESEAMYDAIMHLKKESERLSEEDGNWTDTVIHCGLETEAKSEALCKILESFVDTLNVSTSVSKTFANVGSSSVYFTENIFHVISNFSDRSVANYLALNLLFNNLDKLNFYFRLAFRKDPASYDKLMRVPTDIGRPQQCVEWLLRNMYIPLTTEYIKKAFTTTSIEEVINITQESIQEAADAVSNQEWITEAVRKELRPEIEKITFDINHLMRILTDDRSVNALYNQFHPTHVSFLENVFEHKRFSKVETLLMRHAPAGLFSIGKYYIFLLPGASGGGGTLDVQFGSLLPPVFRVGLQRLINRVTLASMVAHEIGHNLDHLSYHFTEKDPGMKDYINKTLLCLDNQYSQFRFEFIGKNMNGSKYLVENLADTVAISIIDKFIEKHTSEEQDAFLLPGFSYSTKQMLYISSLQVWCEAHTEKDEEFNYDHDSHSLGKFRLLGMLQNSKGFAKAFSCPEESFMNPTSKCLFLT